MSVLDVLESFAMKLTCLSSRVVVDEVAAVRVRVSISHQLWSLACSADGSALVVLRNSFCTHAIAMPFRVRVQAARSTVSSSGPAHQSWSIRLLL